MSEEYTVQLKDIECVGNLYEDGYFELLEVNTSNIEIAGVIIYGHNITEDVEKLMEVVGDSLWEELRVRCSKKLNTIMTK